MDRTSSEWGRWIQQFRQYERADPLERLMAQTERQDNGCLVFTGKSRKNGYALVTEGKTGWHYGHRLVYQRTIGPVPADKPRLHHTCETPLCVEITHLEPTSARGHAALHGLAAGPCRRCGHEDWYVRPDTGTRQCRECKRRRRAAEKPAC